MPVLGIAKQRLADQLGSAATKGEGRQNMLCAYLAGALLLGLLGNVLWGAWWLDPIVGLLIAGAGRQGGPRGVEGGGVLRLRPARRLRARLRRAAEPERALSSARRPRGRQRARAAGAHRALRRRRRPRPPARDGRGRARLLHLLRPGAGRAAGASWSSPSRIASACRRSTPSPPRWASASRQGLRARMIAEPACSWTRWVSRISTSTSPASRERGARTRRSVSAPAMQPVHCGHVGARGLVHVRVGDHVGDGEAPAGPQDARGLARARALVGGEVDHAVGDDDVDATRRRAGSPRCSP